MSLDDQLRDALQGGLPPVEVPAGLADTLIERAAAAPGPGGGRVLQGTAIWIGIAVVAGALLGGALGFFGGNDQPSGVVMDLDGVPVYVCPWAGEVGTLHRGDRVLIIGRTEDGVWLAVRNVRNSGEAVFIRSEHVTEDSDVSGLPVRDCEDRGILAIGPSTVVETTTTTVAESTTTTTSAATTSTTVPATTTTATTTSTMSSTQPPDVTPPVMDKSAAAPTVIWEQDGPNLSCPPLTLRSSTVSVYVTDDTGVAEVMASWTDPSGQRTVAMSGTSGVYSAVFGPYAAGAWDPLSLAPFEHTVSITFTARDAAGNTSSVAVTVTVIEIGDCFG